MWWSPDSQTLFYQDPSTQEAWGYDLETGQISHLPRPFAHSSDHAHHAPLSKRPLNWALTVLARPQLGS
ncbi:MAG: hypothetical protein IPL78_12150 [Chloroflexi bacterium]|nr:hypothetical protein [Chloroflexota bacterium]